MALAAGVTQEGTRVLDDLYAGEFPRKDRSVTIASGEGVLVRGSVMGRVTADGKYKLSDDAAIDGSEVPDAILIDDVDATAADVQGAVYLTGDFSEDAITLGGAHTADSIRQGLRDKSIFLSKTKQL